LFWWISWKTTPFDSFNSNITSPPFPIINSSKCARS
jgi:hypothetical protein